MAKEKTIKWFYKCYFCGWHDSTVQEYERCPQCGSAIVKTEETR